MVEIIVECFYDILFMEVELFFPSKIFKTKKKGQSWYERDLLKMKILNTKAFVKYKKKTGLRFDYTVFFDFTL